MGRASFLRVRGLKNRAVAGFHGALEEVGSSS